MSEPLWKHSASSLAALIRSREVSSREVVQAHIDRVEEVNSHVNAVTLVLAESALKAADEADRTPAEGALHGVPFSIKENIDCKGSPTTQGLPAFENAFPAEDAPSVARMKRAGAIPLMRTNLPELGLRIDTDNPLRGRTFNPWDANRAVGGSSGGEAAAIATGMSPIGLGNDIGGSLRNPAFCCGITSIKATAGRIPWAMTIPAPDQTIAYGLMVSEGPMARQVADVRLGLELLSGWDPRDPFSVPAPLDASPPVTRRAALVTRFDAISMPAAFVAAIRRAGKILESAGWLVEEVQPPEIDRVNEVWGHLLANDIAHAAPVLKQLMSESSAPILQKLLDRFAPSAMAPAIVHMERYRLIRSWSHFFQTWPVVIGPVWPDRQFPINADLDPETGLDLTLRHMHFVTPGNLLGIPAVPVPMGLDQGLPLAVQVYADRWREDLCLEVAELIEQAEGSITPVSPFA